MVYTLWPQMLHAERMRHSSVVSHRVLHAQMAGSAAGWQCCTEHATQMALVRAAGRTWRTGSTAQCRSPRTAGSLRITSRMPVSVTCWPVALTPARLCWHVLDPASCC